MLACVMMLLDFIDLDILIPFCIDLQLHSNYQQCLLSFEWDLLLKLALNHELHFMITDKYREDKVASYHILHFTSEFFWSGAETM